VYSYVRYALIDSLGVDHLGSTPLTLRTLGSNGGAQLTKEEKVSTSDLGGDDNAAKIRALNDALRCNHTGGRVVITRGVATLGARIVTRLIEAVSKFDDFNEDNDPRHEHDFGVVEIECDKFFWKIDYYDATLEAGSEDPADPDQTTRVLTIMRSEEY